MHTFDEPHALIEGFSEYYEESIRLHLQNGEKQRQKTLIITGLATLAFVIGGVLAAYLLYTYTDYDRFNITVFPVIFGAIAGYGAWTYGFSRLKNETKDLLVGDVCEFFDLGYARETKQPTNYSDFVRGGLLPSQNTHLFFTDRIWGEAYDTDLEMTQVFMQDGNALIKGKTTVVNFRGTIISIDFNKRAFGRTVVLRQSALFTPEKKHKMERIRLVDPVFERAFQAYGTDQVEARYILTPDVMQRFVDLEDSVDGKNIRFGFIDQKILIAIETPERFKAGGMTGKLDNPARAQRIINEVAALYDVIDGILGPMKQIEEMPRDAMKAPPIPDAPDLPDTDDDDDDDEIKT